ncbi:hypothetical protein [Modestobacter sp. SYSU DS0290]
MAMTLRLTTSETEALRRRARAEKRSMQEVAKRALGEYIEAHDPLAPLDAVIDEQLVRFGAAIDELGRWRD